jgi:hypothetical protein
MSSKANSKGSSTSTAFWTYQELITTTVEASTRTSKPQLASVIAVALFSSLVILTVSFLPIPFSGTVSLLNERCSLPSAKWALSYTGIASFDRLICTLLTLFHSVLDSPSRPFMLYFLYTFSYLSIIPNIEAARENAPLIISFPLGVGILIQLISGALVTPIYFMLFIQSGMASLHSEPKRNRGKIDQGQAEALLFGFVVGYGIPTACIFTLKNPIATLAWQFFPLWVSLSHGAHLYFRPSSQHPESGYLTVQATYIMIFFFSAVIHWIYFLPHFLFDYLSIVTMFLPSLTGLDPTSVTVEAGSLNLFQWDALLIYVASALVMMWFARNLREAGYILTWVILGMLTFGPGGAIAALWMWRERELNGTEQKTRSD